MVTRVEELHNAERQRLGVTSGFNATATEASFTDSFLSIYRAESLTHKVLTGMVDNRNLPSREQEAAAVDFSATNSLREQLKTSPAWQHDTASLVRLGSARTELHFYQELGVIEDTFKDRKIMEDTPLPLMLAQSIGVGIADPAAWIIGGFVGSGLQAGKTAYAATKVARMGASKTYLELGEKLAHQNRYLFKNPKSATGKARQGKQLEDIAETEKAIMAENAKMAQIATDARVHTVTAMAAIAGTEVAATEFALRDQPGRTVDEAIWNLFGSVALSGLLAKGGKMYNSYIPDMAQRYIDDVEEYRAKGGFMVASDGTDSVNPIGAINSPRTARETPSSDPVGFLQDNADLTTPTVVDDLELEDLQITTREADPDRLIADTYVTMNLSEVEIPASTLKGLRVEEGYEVADDAIVISVNQEGEAFLTSGDLSKVTEDTVRVEIEYLNGGERATGEFEPTKVAEQLGYDPATAPRTDNSPIAYSGPDLAVLNKEADDALRLEFNIDGDNPDMAGYKAAQGKAAKKYTGVASQGALWLARRLHPSLRGMMSELSSVRDITRLLSEHDYMEAGAHVNNSVRDISVETLIKLDERTAVSDLRTILNEGMIELNAAGIGDAIPKKGESNFAALQRKHLTGRSAQYASMQAEIVRYINDPKGYSPREPFGEVQPIIKGIADKLHAKIFKPWEDMQRSMGMLSEVKVPEGMAFYMQRVWDIDRVNSRQHELHKILAAEFYEARVKTYLDAAIKKHEMGGGDVAKVPSDITPGRKELAAKQANKEATDFIESIRGDQLHIADVERFNAKPGSLKARNNIASEKVMDFLDMNLGRNVSAWIKNISPEARLRQRFGKEYTKNLKDAVNNEVSTRVDALNRLEERYAASGEKKQLKAVQKERDAIIKAGKKSAVDLGGMVDVMRNRYGMPKDPDSKLYAASKIIRAWNFATKLGGMTISSLVDPAYLIMKVGWGPALAALSKGAGGNPFNGFRKLESSYRSRGTKEFMEYRNDAHILHTVAELESHSRAEQLAQMQDPTELGSVLDEGVAMVTATFSKLTLMSRWNDWMKSVTHMAFTLKIEDAIKKGDGKFLADMGIDDRMAGLIHNQITLKGLRQQGNMGAGDIDFTAPNIREWHRFEDGTLDELGFEAQQVMRAALTRAVDTTVVTPGAGDLPLMMRSPLGKLLLQFQAFPISILNRVMFPAIQRAGGGDWRQVTNMFTAVLAGMGVYALKQQINEQEISDDPIRWMVEGIERSGIFGIYFNGMSLANELSEGELAKLFFGDDYEAGFMSPDPIMDAATVSWRTGVDTKTALTGIANKILRGEDMTWSQGSAARRIIIGNNLFYFKKGSVAVQDWAMNADKPE